MNGDSRGRKLITVCVCILLSVILLVCSFIQKKAIQEDKVKEEKTTTHEKQIQESKEIEPEPELYQEGDLITIFFTNTTQIDEKGALPFKELEDLTEKTQGFLNSNGIKDTELQVIDGSLRKDGGKDIFFLYYRLFHFRNWI